MLYPSEITEHNSTKCSIESHELKAVRNSKFVQLVERWAVDWKAGLRFPAPGGLRVSPNVLFNGYWGLSPRG